MLSNNSHPALHYMPPLSKPMRFDAHFGFPGAISIHFTSLVSSGELVVTGNTALIYGGGEIR